MTVDNDFLRAICAQPDEDGPRLIYSDYLEEQGCQGHADFIRLSVMMSAPPADLSPRSVYRKKCILHEMLVRHCKEWCPFGEGPPVRSFDSRHEPALVVRSLDRATLVFRRGFVEEVIISWPCWEKHGQEILVRAPLRHVELRAAGRRTEYEPLPSGSSADLRVLWRCEEAPTVSAPGWTNARAWLARNDPGNRLPRQLFLHLTDVKFHQGWKEYPDRAAALADLSDAALRLAALQAASFATSGADQ